MAMQIENLDSMRIAMIDHETDQKPLVSIEMHDHAKGGGVVDWVAQDSNKAARFVASIVGHLP